MVSDFKGRTHFECSKIRPVLRKRQEVTESWINLYNENFHDLYFRLYY